MNSKICLPVLLLVLAVAAWSSPQVLHAEPITFTYEGEANGSLGDETFGARDGARRFVITAYGDTDDRFPRVGDVIYEIEHSSAEIEIEGLGTFAIQTPTRTALNTFTGLAAFSRAVDMTPTSGYDVLLVSDDSLTAWDLLTSFGPTSGLGTYVDWSGPILETSGGPLEFDSATTLPVVTFRALAVPEPATACLLAVAAVAVLVGRPWSKNLRVAD